MQKDPKYTGNQWYLPVKSIKLYSPRCKDDIDSRQTWYNNVTARDLAEDLKYRRKVAMKKYPNLSLAEIELFLDPRRPEYH